MQGIFESDIELAKRLIHDGSSDADVVAALTRRRISEGTATQVVAELRSGREIVTERPTAHPLAPRSPQEETRSHRDRDPQHRSHRSSRSQNGNGSGSTAQKPAFSGIVWVLFVLIMLLGTATVVVILHKRRMASLDTSPAPGASTRVVATNATPAGPGPH